MKDNKKFFGYICLIRVVIILLLIIYHSFAPFCSSWEIIPGMNGQYTLYSWISLLAYSFMLESFVFISGYIFGYQYVAGG